MKLTITEYAGNFVAGNTQEQVEAINLPASLHHYRGEVENSLMATSPKIDVEWDIRQGEGDPGACKVELGPELDDDPDSADNAREEELIAFMVDAVREKVFSRGEFWVNA